MQKYIICIGFTLLASKVCYCQPKTALAASRMNAVPCMATELNIIAERTPCSSLTATTNNGTIAHGGDCRFTYMPAKPGPATISVFVKRGADLHKLTDYKIRVQRLPPPDVSLQHRANGSMPAAQLRLSIGPQVVYSDFDLGPSFKIYAFTVVLVRNNEVIFTRRHEDPEKRGIGFDAATLNEMGSIRSGDLLWIKDIAAFGAGADYTDLNEIEIYAN